MNRGQEGLRVELLSQMGESLGGQKEILDRILAAGKTTFEADICNAMALDPINGGYYWPPQSLGELKVPMDRYAKPRERGVTQTVIQKGAVFCEDLAKAPELKSEFAKNEEICSFVGLALPNPGKAWPFALIYFNYKQKQNFWPELRQWMLAFRDQAAGWLHSAWLLSRNDAVVEIGREINRDLSTVDVLFEELKLRIDEVVNPGLYLVLVVNRSETETVDIYYTINGETKVSADYPVKSLIAKVIEEGKTLVIDNYETCELEGENLDAEDDRTPLSLIFVPLVLRQRVYGVLSIQHKQADYYDQDDVRFLELLGNQVTSALAGIHLFESLDNLNRVGGLLVSRTTTDSVLEEVVQRCREVTFADYVVLYPYEQKEEAFELPPKTAGTLLSPGYKQPTSLFPGQLPEIAVNLEEPGFFRTGGQLHEELRPVVVDKTNPFQKREQICSVAVAPLRLSGETLGALILNFRKQQLFDASQKRLIQGLSVFAAIAIKNARNLEALDDEFVDQFEKRTKMLKRRALEHRVLREIDQELQKKSGLKDILKLVLEKANEVIGADEAGVLLLHPEKKRYLEVACAIGSEAGKVEGEIFSLADQQTGFAKQAFLERRPIMEVEVALQSRFIGLRTDIYAELDVPLIAGNPMGSGMDVVGVLNFERRRRRAFTEEDRAFALTLAGQVTLAIKMAEANAQLKRYADEQELLSFLGREITSHLDLNQLLDSFLKRVLEKTGAKAGVLMLMDQERQDLEIKTEFGIEGVSNVGRRFSLNEGIVGRVARDKKMLNIDPTEEEWKKVHVAIFKDSRSELAVPLLEKNRVLGVLNLEDTRPARFQEREVRLVESLANLAVIALQNADRYKLAEAGRQQMEALQQVTQEIIRSTGEPDKIMITIVHQALKLTDSSIGELILYQNKQPFEVYRVMGHGENYHHEKVTPKKGDGFRPLAENVTDQVMATLKTYCTPRVSPKDPLYTGSENVSCIMAAPLIDGVDGSLIGILHVFNAKPYGFGTGDEKLLRLFGDEAVVAIQNSRNYQDAQRELKHFHTLVETAEALGELDGTHREKAAEVILGRAVEECRCPAVLRVLDKKKKAFVLWRSKGVEAEKLFLEIPRDQGLTGEVFRTNKVQMVRDSWNPGVDSIPIIPSNRNFRSYLIAPVLVGGAFYGTIGLSHELPHFFHESESKLIQGLAKLLAVTLQRMDSLRKERETRELSKQAEIMSWIDTAGYELAHRLGNELGLVDSYVTNIKQLLDERGALVAEVAEELESITNDVQQVLDLSDRLKETIGESIPNEPKSFRVRNLVTDLEERFRNRTPGIDLSLPCPKGIVPVFGMEKLAFDVLVVIIDNAVEAVRAADRGDAGRISLLCENQNEHVAISVSDNGTGIPEENLKKIFKFMYSTKNSSGFGLWDAARKAKASGGRIEVETSLGTGTTFRLLLPRSDGILEGDSAT